ncbi:molybdopterin-guanine dinucleotide biosynthesis protein MobB [Desulfohalovibrio reitneri]|uniref:molybdopterin-guanine dinucleotide biosynthesis protein MobB n=1 Tax=Desulfohalovibrio reitneri TaxID=1307759 RepID=UPI0004A755CB|nr:molybdopterin-guanine dinucleotide biosynthesis protein MobB [Desulfohalovibrio reitneri]
MIGVNVVGFKNSGKTTTAVELCRELSGRGLKVAGAKFADCRFDREDSDTGRLGQHCQAVVGLSPHESMVVWPQPRYLADLLPLLSCDVLVVEGGKSLGWLPRVLMVSSAEDLDELTPELALASCGSFEVEGKARPGSISELADIVQEKGFILPGLDCGECGFDTCAGLGARIVAGQASLDNCKASTGEVKVTVGGRQVGLNHFTAQLLRNTVMGFLSGLKGFAPGPVTIELE